MYSYRTVVTDHYTVLLLVSSLLSGSLFPLYMQVPSSDRNNLITRIHLHQDRNQQDQHCDQRNLEALVSSRMKGLVCHDHPECVVCAPGDQDLGVR